MGDEYWVQRRHGVDRTQSSAHVFVSGVDCWVRDVCLGSVDAAERRDVG